MTYETGAVEEEEWRVGWTAFPVTKKTYARRGTRGTGIAFLFIFAVLRLPKRLQDLPYCEQDYSRGASHHQ